MTKVSARLVGCPPEAVALSDIHREGTRPRTWTATCLSTVWTCSNKAGTLTCRSGSRACHDSWGTLICEDAGPSAQAP